jgi:NADPH-dependent stearoyl-CoA 9-desaturase
MQTTTELATGERAERVRAFGKEIDRIKSEVESRIGADDVRYVKRMRWLSRGAEVVGRGLLYVSFEPLGFVAGVLALWLHKQLEATEIGHTALHGAYDGLDGAEKFQSKTFRWEVPIDEESWRAGHNVRHHGATNVAGRDADIHFGPVRLTEQTPWRRHHRWQLPFTLLVLFPNFGFLMNLHFTGLSDLYEDNGLPEKLDFLPDRSPASRRLAWKRALRKYAPYYFKEYVFFPALAGPFFWKILLGNWLSEVLRDVYSAATIFCGHVGEHVAAYPKDGKARSRAEWYAMQVEATNNYEVSWPVSVLCGGLDRQIEHHLFPKFPPERLRQVAPQVRAAAERHGIRYHSASWGKVLGDALGWIATLSRERGAAGATREALRAMS